MVRPSVLAGLAFAGALLAIPALARAQEATISGTITDTTGGVLPGVVVTAVHEASGNTFEAVTDGAGGYRISVRIGTYRLRLELPGFAPLERAGLQMQVGQQAVVSLQMSPATLQESVTVTADAPLINVTQSNLGSTVSAEQVENLPLNGRNWVDLTLLSPGSKQNFIAETPAISFQLNVDGQQVTQNIALTFGQPRFSKDTIAEFEVITNRFDARQGRSTGIQVNAITKSGANTAAGTISGYFRDDNFNAADPIQLRVLPYSNQQLSTTYGGPIVRDRFHYFANFEYEREPYVRTYSSAFPSFNVDQPGTRTEKKGGVRFDYQFSTRTRLTVRTNIQRSFDPLDARWSGGNLHPSSATAVPKESESIANRLTHVIGERAVNEFAFNWNRYHWKTQPIVNWPNHPLAPFGMTNGSPTIQFRGYRVGQQHNRSPQILTEKGPSLSNNFIYTFNKGGRHDLNLGGEYVYSSQPIFLGINSNGLLDVQGGAIPANIEQLFPLWNDISTWNLNALNPIVRFYQLAVGNFESNNPITNVAGWVQDDWTLGRLTLNLGLRYDIIKGTYGEERGFDPWLLPDRPLDKNNIQPRLGFAYGINDRTVMRGGWGLFYGGGTGAAHAYYTETQIINVQVNNDGRPDFASNPFNGPIPTYEQVARSGALRSLFLALPSDHPEIPFAHQASVGVQRQFGSNMSLAADLVYSDERSALTPMDINLAYNPATGANYPFNVQARRLNPGWGNVNMNQHVPKGGEDVGLQLELNKRMSDNWQASLGYSLTAGWDYQYPPVRPGCQYALTNPAPGVFTCDAPITLHPVLQYERFRSPDQMHRLTVNGIWQLPYGFQASGLYFFADNGKATPTSGVDALLTGTIPPAIVANTVPQASPALGRLRANGTMIERNSFDRSDLHRVDVRLLKRVNLRGRMALEGTVEVFNLFNHENYNSFVLNESARNFGAPSFDSNIAFQPRTMQFGFRVTF
jgi:hypothetical protein